MAENGKNASNNASKNASNNARKMADNKAGSKTGRRWSRRALPVALLLIVLSFVVVALNYSHKYREEQQIVLRVNGEAVSTSEAVVYYRLMRDAFEEEAGKNVWDLTVLGLDPTQAAIDRTLDSIVRVKIAKPLAGEIYNSERPLVDQAEEELWNLLGEEYCQQYGITRDLVQQVVEEGYLAARYEERARFRTSEFESDIERGLKEQFGAYEEMDQAEYLRTYVAYPMMFYTGQWVADEWISYSDTQKEQILANCQAVLDVSDPRNFTNMARYFSDDNGIDNNPVFHRGAVENPKSAFFNVYLGQMSLEVQEVLRRTAVNQMTGIITTDYGYLVLYVTGIREAVDSDYQEYIQQLDRAKAAYRADLLEELKAQRLEEEWQRITEEADVTLYRQRWSRYVQQEVLTGN